MKAFTFTVGGDERVIQKIIQREKKKTPLKNVPTSGRQGFYAPCGQIGQGHNGRDDAIWPAQKTAR